MAGAQDDPTKNASGPLERLLGAFGEVRPGEGRVVILMMLNIFMILLAYYIIKVAREPLILSIEPQTFELFGSTIKIPGGAELKSYGAAGQALVLMAYVPFYSWFASRVDRSKLIVGVTLFFLANIALFAGGVAADVPNIGIAFFIWCGIFSLSIIAQFWSYANDIYTKDQGERLFPIIAIGMTAGPVAGSYFAGLLYKTGITSSVIIAIAGGVLALQLAIMIYINRQVSAVAVAKAGGPQEKPEQLGGSSGFTLLFKSKYLILIALLLFLLNVVNTTGEYILGESITAMAPAEGKKAFIGGFYGEFFSVVNVVAILLQAFVASRIVKFFGIAGVVLMLPIVALGAYGLIGAGVGFAMLRWAKTAENATDYSIMNTAKGMLWLVTSREEKYKAKQAIDTFVVRVGDVASAFGVGIGINVLGLSVTGFARANVVVIVLWLLVGVALVRMYKRLADESKAG